MSEEADKIQDLSRGTGGRALVYVEVTFNDVKRVVAKHMVNCFDVCKSKLQTAIVVSKKAISVQIARPDCWKVYSKRSNNSRDTSVNSCELNPEKEGDDPSFQMYEDSTKREDAEGYGLYRSGTDGITHKPYVVSVQLGNGTVNIKLVTVASRSTVSQ